MSKEERKMTQEEKAAKQEWKQRKGRERLETQKWSQKVNDKGIHRYGKDTDIKDQRLRNSQQILWDSNKGENELHNDQIVLLLNLFTMPFARNLWMTRRVCIYLGESSSCKKTRTFSPTLSWWPTTFIICNEKSLLHTNLTISGQVQMPSACLNSKNTSEKVFQIYCNYTLPVPLHVSTTYKKTTVLGETEEQKRRSRK